ncbi:hypothetical protein LEP1GSC047_2958 [Leptospira inadai serovar Lyme str. 10]|uniref:PD-(D/E)XK nuclease family transposase n=2 Tax=Leptospira inadai serovar Lyme TaxID=293084 RepID=V6HCQ4_9LEPT|nr:Rpn family recombination-promoting nuclease/putative transposase [Leptospira inadai]EQA36698.1 hypothetical protein LEP1GSC047_2958 [Leptospira inadai serovar Lyme str. 10]PNV71309.1 hypothetical protein BES34_021635 [Leptospira inadai serovar Lyme]
MPFFPLTNDLVFKSLFVEEPKLLSSILTSVLYPNGDHRVEEITILNPELPTDYPGDKRSYLDLRARDESGRIFHVEVQVAHQSTFIKRSLYYLSGLIRDQLKSGDGYGDLKPVYQINILDFRLIPGENYHSKFKLREEENPEITLTDELEIHFLELPKLPEEEKLRLLREGDDLYRWMYVFKHTSELTEEEMGIVVDKTPDLNLVFELLETYSSEPEKKRQIEEKIKADRDYAYDVAGNYGRGKLEGKLEDARKMLAKGIDLKTVLEITELAEKNLRDHGIL